MVPFNVLLILLTCVASSASDFDYPWVTADGSSPSRKLNTSSFNITAAIAEMKKKPVRTRDGPTLVSRSWKRFVVSRGATVTLNCTVLEAGDVSVSWSRNKEVLTNGRYRYTSDDRISPMHEAGSCDYGLRFVRVQPEDSAVYKCHVGTEPEQVAAVNLVVIDAYSVIFGASEVSVAAGGTLYLLCMVLQVSDIPEYILWYRDNTVIDYTKESISVKTEEDTRSSELQVRNINFTDSGNYTCQPSNAIPANVIVHVFKDSRNKRGPTQKCDDCVLFLQLGATFAFFTLSFVIAFCIHSRDNSRPRNDDPRLSEEFYLTPDMD
ncbi:fibroblast growth factor receptor-like isoform X1 [Macrobrachium nipponense]|uniref:fibroblast growth factor receptor-like isoform X1 n=1 Tax=Macrobrachium nipponense TaxID=159736 RepID=UPI0030C85FDB